MGQYFVEKSFFTLYTNLNVLQLDWLLSHPVGN